MLLAGLFVAAGMYLILRHAVFPLADSFTVATTRVRRIADVSAGVVAIQGRASGTSAIQSPFSGRSALLVQADIYLEDNVKRSRDYGIAGTISLPQAGCFTLNDPSGAIDVYFTGCDLIADEQAITENFSPEATELIDSLRPKNPLLGFGARAKIVERLLADGDSVYALGTATRRDSLAPAFLAAAPGQPFVLSLKGRRAGEGDLLRRSLSWFVFGLFTAALGVIAAFIGTFQHR